MNLKILLPQEVFADESGVTRIVVETRAGSYGLLPHRLDCVAALVPGILIYQTRSDPEVFAAVDEGVLVKTGSEVLISARRAMHGENLSRLREGVEREFLTMDEQERGVRSVLARLEAGFLRRFAMFSHG